MKKISLLAGLLFCFNVYAQLPAYVPTNGLVGYWPFTGNTNDQSGNGNNGVNTSATLATDRFGMANSAYYFNGNATILTSIPANYAPSASNFYSFSLWYNINTVATSKMIMSYKGGQNTTNTSNYDILSSHSGCNPNTIAVQNYPFNNPSACSPSTVNIGVWTHLYVVFNQIADSFRVYKNAQFWFSGVIGNAPPLAGYLTFGNNSGGGFGLNGSLDDIGVWNRSLSSCEIQQLYNSALPSFSVAISNPSVCVGQSTTLTATGSSSYTWATLSVTNNSVVVSPSVTTTYSVFSNCGSTNTITVFINSNPQVSISTNASVLCFDQIATLTASGAVSYLWNVGSTGSSIFVSPPGNTSYTVTGTDSNGCSSSAVITQSVALCTGVRDSNNATQKISIYPIPTRGLFSITGVDHFSSFEIYDVIGNLISKKTTGDIADVDLSAQPGGIYFIKINIDNASIIKRLIKE